MKCPECGTENPKDVQYCENCGAELNEDDFKLHSRRINVKILIGLLIITLLGILIYISLFGLTFEGKESDFYLPAVTGDSILAYKNSCIELNLAKVAEDPEAFIGKKVKVTGQIYKKEEYFDFNKTRTHIVLSVPKLFSDPYILTSYTGTLPFKKGDNITVYGEYIYPCVDDELQNELQDNLPEELKGTEVALPSIKAGYIEKINS
ncbi:zinc ribbon domain-containing protein [Methanobacterium oryzae]|uniref:zinc ribbon domain-containing protein n=1 Tax=Methanobacterium oryzae TaxID=69540 RepID=UPI003D227A63